MTEYPKVTEEYMESRIEKILYTRLPSGTTTICQIILNNGFTVIGESACVSPENYNKEIGESIAYKNAFEKLWSLFGFLLKEQLYISNMIKAPAQWTENSIQQS